MEVTFDLQTPNGAPAEALAAVIEARRRELGETAMQSCIAMAEGILRSLRAQTKVASEKKADIKINCVTGMYVPSWKRAGAKAYRVLRQGVSGPTVTDQKVVWLTEKYTKGEVLNVYEVIDTSIPDKPDKYLAVSPSQKKAKDYSKTRHQRRVLRYKGLARAAISLAMKAVYDKGAAPENITSRAMDVAKMNTQVRVNDTGFNSGSASVYVHDGLDYATDALKGGESSVNAAVNAAMRKTTGFIMQKVKSNGGSIDGSLKATLEELIGAQT